MNHQVERSLRDVEKRWSNLTIADDFVFGKVMQDEDICREVLEAILGVQIDRIEYVGREDALDVAPEGRGVRLDVYVRDGRGTVYDVEMQATNTRELPQRARFYQTMLTFAQIGKGDTYLSLKDSYVIFICTFDLFGLGGRVYSFESRCVDRGELTLGDGVHTIFLAASSPREPSRGDRVNELLDYVATGEVSGELSSKLRSAVSRVLDDKNWRLEYMWQYVRDQLNIDKGRQLGFHEGHDAGVAEGIEQGRREGREAGVAEGREAGIEQGRREGREEGIAEGEAHFALLISHLVTDGRLEDVSRASSDDEFRRGLYKEYGLLQ